jgi:hypothetical protein
MRAHIIERRGCICRWGFEPILHQRTFQDTTFFLGRNAAVRYSASQTPSPGHFISARTLFGTFATTLYFESTSSAMSYFSVDANRMATSLSLSL